MTEMIGIIIEMIYSLASLAWSVLPVIGMWQVFEKAGEQGWKAIIPFYNMYTLFKIGDRRKYWKMYLIGVILFAVTYIALLAYAAWMLFAFIAAFAATDLGWDAIITALPVMGIAALAALAGYVLMLIAQIHAYSGMCKKMGQGAGMVVGLLFLGPIFWLILGCSKEYQWQHDTFNQDPYTQQYNDPYSQWNEPYQQ